MEFESTGVSTIYLRIPTQAIFEQLIDLKDLPESVLELAETRELVDEYLDTEDLALSALGMDLRTTIVAKHHFLIFNEIKRPGTLLASATEHVERLTPPEYAAARLGDRSNKLFSLAAGYAKAPLAPVLHRQATFQSRLFKVGETRFEFGLEAVVYQRNGKTVTEQLASLDLIQGDQEILEAMAHYLEDEFELGRTYESTLVRGVRLVDQV